MTWASETTSVYFIFFITKLRFLEIFLTVCAGAHRAQKSVLSGLRAGVTGAVSHLTSVLETNLESWAQAQLFHSEPLPPAPQLPTCLSH